MVLPGMEFIYSDSVGDVTVKVIASGIDYRLDGDVEYEVFGLLVLRSEPPYYEVLEARAIFDPAHPVISHGTEYNIVPAVRLFDETFGFWGGP